MHSSRLFLSSLCCFVSQFCLILLNLLTVSARFRRECAQSARDSRDFTTFWRNILLRLCVISACRREFHDVELTDYARGWVRSYTSFMRCVVTWV